MCAPVVGALSLASGVMGAVGQHQSASASAAAQNSAAASNYRYALKVRQRNWLRETERYRVQTAQYNTAVANNQEAAQRAYASEQQRLNEIFRKASFSKQNQLVQLAQASGKAAATGRTGKSMDRLDTDIVSQFGRNQAIMAQSLLGAQNAFGTRVDSIRREQLSANNQAYSQVAIAPEQGIAPPPPTMVAGPSGLGLLAGIAGAGVNAVGAYKDAGGTLPNWLGG